jgi:hypothetical protein
MKQILSAFLTLAMCSVLSAQHLTPEDRQKGVAYLEKTRDAVMTATKGLTEAQWNFKPGPDRWSVAEVTEHIAAAEDSLMTMVQEKVMKAPARTSTEDVKALDEMVLQKIPDRSNKAQAPEPLKPTNRFGSPEASLKHFQESRARTIDFLKGAKGLREHAVESPFGKQLDGYEWVLFVAAHSERHTKQINEVKADSGFPKK